MSKQEIYAWTSLLSSIAILGFYGLTMFGLPSEWAAIEDQLSSVLFKIFLFALIVEVGIGILKNKHEVEKDERDEKIAGKGFKNAYYFLAIAVSFVLFQVIMDNIFSYAPFIYSTISLIHLLVVTLVLSSIVNRTTQIYFYRKM